MEDNVKSTHRCEVIELKLHKHPNADKLSVAQVFGYTCVCNTEEWAGVNLAVWLPPDSLVDTSRPEFVFLAKEAKYNANSETDTLLKSYARVRAKKIRGVVSYGLLVPAPEGAQIGSDMAEQLGVFHYEPQMTGKNSSFGGLVMSGEDESQPVGVFAPKYDVDSFQRYAHQVFTPGELVWVTCKIHGANAKYVYSSAAQRMYCGSRTNWKKQYPTINIPDKTVLIEQLSKRSTQDQLDTTEYTQLLADKADNIIARLKAKMENPPENIWWQGLRAHPEIESWCREHPDVLVYGELYGTVQKGYSYGVPQGQVRVAVFDILAEGKWLDPEAARLAAPALPWVPTVAKDIPYDFDTLVALAEGPSLVPGAKNIREGIVISPVHERYHEKIGRVKLKVVSAAYLEGK